MDAEGGWEDDKEIPKALWKKAAVQDRNKLEFQVYQKENQLLKYVDTQSTHCPSTFPSIATRVITRLCRLMSQDSGLRETQ
eukprot:4609343-Ditylum_brightwellii.AAC.1